MGPGSGLDFFLSRSVFRAGWRILRIRFHRFFEIADTFAETLAETRELVDAKDQDDDREQDQQLGKTETSEHDDLPGLRGPFDTAGDARSP